MQFFVAAVSCKVKQIKAMARKVPMTGAGSRQAQARPRNCAPTCTNITINYNYAQAKKANASDVDVNTDQLPESRVRIMFVL